MEEYIVEMVENDVQDIQDEYFMESTYSSWYEDGYVDKRKEDFI